MTNRKAGDSTDDTDNTENAQNTGIDSIGYLSNEASDTVELTKENDYIINKVKVSGVITLTF